MDKVDWEHKVDRKDKVDMVELVDNLNIDNVDKDGGQRFSWTVCWHPASSQ